MGGKQHWKWRRVAAPAVEKRIGGGTVHTTQRRGSYEPPSMREVGHCRVCRDEIEMLACC
jgi:hypothetical protein